MLTRRASELRAGDLAYVGQGVVARVSGVAYEFRRGELVRCVVWCRGYTYPFLLAADAEVPLASEGVKVPR